MNLFVLSMERRQNLLHHALTSYVAWKKPNRFSNPKRQNDAKALYYSFLKLYKKARGYNK